MELIGFVGLLALVWVALAVVCVRRGRGGWVVAAVLVPVPVAAVAVGVAGAIVRSREVDSLQRLGEAYAALGAAAGLAVLSSYVLLGIGAIAPGFKIRRGTTTGTTRIHYRTRWRPTATAEDSGGWERGPEFYDLDAARRWALGSGRVHGESVVEIYTEEPATGLVEIVDAIAQPPAGDPAEDTEV